MPKGFDTPNSCTALAGNIKASGYDFVCRYYSDNPRKNLTAPEAAALSSAGLSIVAVWEDNPTADAYFTHARGLDEGTRAYYMALTVGQAAGSAIYFAVDYDPDPIVIGGAIADYFQGITDGFAAMARGGTPAYAVGIYGSGAVCGAGLAAYGWLAQATGWRGTSGFTGWNIQQGRGGTFLGIGVDLDDAAGDYGAFTV
jgi:hypothetical protein